jgi:hypothetical protein
MLEGSLRPQHGSIPLHTPLPGCIPEENTMQHDETFGMGLAPGALHYRAFVGPPDRYDLVAAMQFNILTHFGLREHHFLLDIGCGSLRFGRLAIPYLRPGRYFGIEPNRWLIDEGIEKECGRDLIRIKQPRFSNSGQFELTQFGVTFDYLLAQSIFSHAPQAQIKKCMSEAAKCMHQASKFLATYFQGDVDFEGVEWQYPGCCTYTEATMIRFASAHGLQCAPLSWEHPNGQHWLLLTKQSLDGEA